MPIISTMKLEKTRWMGHVARVGGMTNACNILINKSEGKRPLRRCRLRWEEILKYKPILRK